jgi:hypothetical protein
VAVPAHLLAARIGFGFSHYPIIEEIGHWWNLGVEYYWSPGKHSQSALGK